ncbi:hypothetical protein [Halobacterium wangiae]|uniref:hypothetical protein n=1 Tax=Halobacterium wangiae TaxID=2902623 RepID=UPI001E57BA89|nr:hypothetical protein [Halobacterium wangiae]
MNRRAVLSSIGTAALVAVAGCGSSNDDRSTPEGDSTPTGGTGGPPSRPPGSEQYPQAIADEFGFENVVNFAEVGADQTGNRAADDLFEEHLTDNQLLYLPPGRYQIDDTMMFGGDGSKRLGLVGENATIVPPDGFESVLFGFGYPSPLSELLVEGLTFDCTARNTGARPFFVSADDRVVAKNLTVRGEIDVNQDLLRFDVTSKSGQALVKNINLPDGAVPGTGVTGMEVGDKNHGDLRFEDCHVAGFPDNGLYANPPEGSVEVLGGTFLNNGVAGVRIETANESVVRGVHVRCDDASGAGENMRGIRLRSGKSLLVEDCLVELLDVTTSDGAVTFSSELGSATVRNCQIQVDADNVNAVRIKEPEGGGSERGPFRCENVVIRGTAAGAEAIQAANRDGCKFDNVCVHQTGKDRDGLVADNVGGEVQNTYISVTGDPISSVNSAITRTNVDMNRQPEETSADIERYCGAVDGTADKSLPNRE